MDKLSYFESYEDELHRKADKSYPDLEDRYCPQCGNRLVRGSVSYYEGFHFDSCDWGGLFWS